MKIEYSPHTLIITVALAVRLTKTPTQYRKRLMTVYFVFAEFLEPERSSFTWIRALEKSTPPIHC
jgi:hypothetical protein